MTKIINADIHQYLTFTIAHEVYAINVSNIKEVLGVPRITKVPRMPDFMSGIINLRGTVVPVLDLRKKFNLGETLLTPDTAIIVTEINTSHTDEPTEELIIGIYSDMVKKVITIEPSQIEPVPKIGIAINTDFIFGMGHVDEDFIIILDINRILSTQDLGIMETEKIL